MFAQNTNYYNYCFRIIMKLPRYCSACIMFVCLRLMPYYENQNKVL